MSQQQINNFRTGCVIYLCSWLTILFNFMFLMVQVYWLFISGRLCWSRAAQFGDHDFASCSKGKTCAFSEQKFHMKYIFWHCPCIDAAVPFIMILQIEYPENVHLIRGNHEAADINALFGFRIECIERMVWMNGQCQAHTNIVIQ